MAKKKPSFSTVVALMSDNTQARLAAESEKIADTLPLKFILPDFSQPRNLLPTTLTQEIASGELSPQAALQQWLALAETAPNQPGQRRTVLELKRLADSIARHGLINPISVRPPRPDETVPPGCKYLVVTGERRYWAHIYLLSNNKEIKEGDATASPADVKVTFTADGVSVKAHQLIENILRENINAVERAHGFWALRYELSGVNYSSPSADSGEADAGTVNDSSPQLIPWARVEEALGISKRYRIFVTSVLNLSDEAQGFVQRYHFSEMTIRPIVQKLKGRPDLQLKALKQLAAWQVENETEDGPGRAIVASVKELVEQLLAADKAPERAATASKITRSVSSEPVIRFRDKVRQTLDFLNRLKTGDRSNLNKALAREEYAEIIIDLRLLREQIDQILTSTAQTAEESEAEAPTPQA